MSIRVLITTLFLPLSILLVTPGQEIRPDEPTLEEAGQFVFHAVLEGLYADGVRNDVVDALTTRDEETGWPHHFIYACPVCMPSWDAFAVYRQRPGFFSRKLPRDTWGPGLDEETRRGLLEGGRGQRMFVLRELVRRWIDARLDRQRLIPAEREAYAKRFERMRKEGLGFLRVYQADEKLAHIYAGADFCPFCDAACEAPQ